MGLTNKARKKITRRFDNLESENEYLTQSIQSIFALLAGAFILLAGVAFFYDVIAARLYLHYSPGIGWHQWTAAIVFTGLAVWCVRRI